MSGTIEIYMRRDALPTVAAWQEEITRKGHDLTLDIGDPLRSQSGFQPARHNDADTGFEFYFDFLSNGSVLPHGLDVGERDAAALFRFGGDLREMNAALAASGVLAEMCDGITISANSGIDTAGPEAARDAERTETAGPNRHKKPWWRYFGWWG